MFYSDIIGAGMTYVIETTNRPTPNNIRQAVRKFTDFLQFTVPVPWHFPNEDHFVDQNGRLKDCIPVFPDTWDNYELKDPRERDFWVFEPRLKTPNASMDLIFSSVNYFHIVFHVMVLRHKERLDGFLSRLFAEHNTPVPERLLTENALCDFPAQEKILWFSIRESSGILFFGTNEEYDDAAVWPDQIEYACVSPIGVLRLPDVLSVATKKKELLASLELSPKRKPGPLTTSEQSRLAISTLSGQNREDAR